MYTSATKILQKNLNILGILIHWVLYVEQKSLNLASLLLSLCVFYDTQDLILIHTTKF